MGMEQGVLVEVLGRTLTGNAGDTTAASEFIKEATQANFTGFILGLSQILVNTSNKPEVRQQAGLQLKNLFYSNDVTVKEQYVARWAALSEDVRSQVKSNIVTTLGTESTKPSSAAQCVAFIACIELPHNEWSEIMTILVDSVSNASPEQSGLKRACLESIGYICQDIDYPAFGENYGDKILSAIVKCVVKTEPDLYTRLKALTALHNSLELTRTNFEVESERNFIMMVICEATQVDPNFAPEDQTAIQVQALQCLVKIVGLYYKYLEPYMSSALFAITRAAMQSKCETIALQGLEFWSSICEEEQELLYELQEAQEECRQPSNVSLYYAKGAFPYLVTTILDKLPQLEEDEDEDAWNPHKAAGVCLMLMAQTVGDEVMQAVLAFVQTNLISTEWNKREAALMAFGSILEGPNQDSLRPWVTSALDHIIPLLEDPHLAVRDTAAWCLSRLCEVCVDVVTTAGILEKIVDALMKAVTMEPGVATNGCWAVGYLAEAAYNVAIGDELGDVDPLTYSLSPCFDHMIAVMLQVASRTDDGNFQWGLSIWDPMCARTKGKLRVAAYEAIMNMIKNSAADCNQTVYKTTFELMNRLEILMQTNVAVLSCELAEQYEEMLSLLCATLQNVVKKIPEKDLPSYADKIMESLLHMMASNSKSAAVQTDGLFAVGGLIEAAGESSVKYMGHLLPLLLAALGNTSNTDVCIAAVNIIGDMSRALGQKMEPYASQIMEALMRTLQDQSSDRSVKPPILCAFGDIAICLGTSFQPYFQNTMIALQQACCINLASSSDIDDQFMQELRENILHAYTGIVQGLKGNAAQPGPEITYLQPHVDFIIKYLRTLIRDENRTDEALGVACGLVGDLIVALGSVIQPLIVSEHMADLVKLGVKSRTPKTKQTAKWCLRELRKLEKAA